MIRPRALSFRDKNLNLRVRVPYIGRGLNDTITYDYLITNDAEWTSTFALGAATLSGKTIAVAPGNYTSKTISSFNPAATVRVISSSASSKPQIDQLVLNGASKLTFEDLRIVSSAWSSSSAACISFTSSNSDLAFKRCDVLGNYRGTVDFDIDTNSDTYPEYAVIRPVFNGSGVVTSFAIGRNNVGDLLADGNYAMTFHNYGGITFTVAPVGNFDVVGGIITSANFVSGGSSNANTSTGAGIRSNLLRWAGQQTMVSYLPNGAGPSSSTVSGSLLFEDCNFRLMNKAISGSVAPGGSFTVRGCTFDKIYQDFMQFGGTAGSYTVTVEDCFATRPFSYMDAGDPHSDWMQFFTTSGSHAWGNITVERNIFIQGSARGAQQGIFISDSPSGGYDNVRIVGNLFVNREASQGFILDDPIDGFIYRNAFVRFDPTDTARNVSTINANLTGVITGDVFIGDNIWEGGPIGEASDASVRLGFLGGTLSYGSVFVNHTGPRTTVSEIASAYTPQAAYAGKGPFGDTAYINHAGRTTNRNLEPTVVKFASIINQTASTSVSSNWSRLVGGVNGRSITISGGEYRTADDRLGTNATAWTSSAGTVTLGKFIQVRHTTGVAGSVTTTTTLTIGDRSYNFQSTTVPVATFTAVDNQATAWSRFAFSGLDATANIRKIALAVRFKADAAVAGQNILAESGTNQFRFWFSSTTALRFQTIGSTRVNLRPVLDPGTTTTRTHIITLDFTNPTPNEGCFWATYEDGVLLSNSPGSGGVFDTRSVAGSGSDYGSLIAPERGTGTGIFGSSTAHLGFFAEGDGGGTLFDGDIEFFWMDWGGSSYALPDITDATTRAKWTADLIGANGSGPTGSQPKIYYTGSVAGWNAGLANLGTLTLPLDKQAGTYV